MRDSVAVIGGGAAGFFTAIHAARKDPDTKVTIYEGSGKTLTKVLISGGGRCNVTHNMLNNRELITFYPRGERELQGAFSRFAVQDTIDWFHNEGVKLKTEADGRMFPTTNSSHTIANTLRDVAKDLGVSVVIGHKLVGLQKEGEFFHLKFHNRKKENADRVILTTGGTKSSYELALGLGHSIVPPVPSLFTFKINDPLIKGLEGISFKDVGLELRVAGKKFQRSGPLLITHWGLSGPAIIQLSSLAARELFETDYDAQLTVSFSPEINEEKVIQTFHQVKKENGKKLVYNTQPAPLPKRFWERAIETSGISIGQNVADSSKDQLKALARAITNKVFHVTGKGVFKEEFVTCGGISLREVDFKTMESKITPGLYFAGEILDIDGITGGFNFQNAWTTGWIAGNNCTGEREE